MIFCTYVPLNFLYELVVPPKATKQLDLTKNTEEAQATETAREKAAAIEGKGQPAIDLEAENIDKASNASDAKSKKPESNNFE